MTLLGGERARELPSSDEEGWRSERRGGAERWVRRNHAPYPPPANKVTNSERSEASAVTFLKTNNSIFLAGLGMTAMVDSFTPSEGKHLLFLSPLLRGETCGSRAGRVAQRSKPDRALAFRGAQAYPMSCIPKLKMEILLKTASWTA